MTVGSVGMAVWRFSPYVGPCKIVSPSLRLSPESRKRYWISTFAGMTVMGQMNWARGYPYGADFRIGQQRWYYARTRFDPVDL